MLLTPKLKVKLKQQQQQQQQQPPIKQQQQQTKSQQTPIKQPPISQTKSQQTPIKQPPISQTKSQPIKQLPISQTKSQQTLSLPLIKQQQQQSKYQQTISLPHISLPPISQEQNLIVEFVGLGFNVAVDAVAGSGKTTTNLHLAHHSPLLSILLLTYNTKLKLETRKKAENLGLENLEIHSYHSFCVKYFNRNAFTDIEILKFLKNKTSSLSLLPFNYDLIVIDEAQDMNFLYYELVQEILHRLNHSPQIIIMGDQKQSIYGFNGADPRFLALSSIVFHSKKEWKKCSLNVSYRLTDQMSSFINNCCRGLPVINTNKSGAKVKYMICDVFGGQPLYEIQRSLNQGKYKLDEIFILTASVRSQVSPVRNLANKLTEIGIPIYVPTNDEEKLDESLLIGKIVFSTFHQVKGLERPYVMVFGFDQKYYEYYAKDIPKNQYDQIPNTIYVAITRAQKQLVLLHHHKNDYFDFLRSSLLHQHCDLIGRHISIPERLSKPKPSVTYSVTDLIKFLPIEIIDKCMSYLDIDEYPGESFKLDIPSKVKQDLYEGVAEINGTAIPSYFEYTITKKMTISEHLIDNIMHDQVDDKKFTMIDDDDVDLYENLMNNIKLSNDICSSLLQLTTHWVCHRSGYNFKKVQIKKYEWLSLDVLITAINRLKTIFPKNVRRYLEFEKLLLCELESFKIIGFADIFDTLNYHLWELKMVDAVENSHFLQAVIYAWMINQSHQNHRIPEITVYNIMNNTQYKIRANFTNVSEMVKILINHKNNVQIYQNNQEFLNKCLKITTSFNSADSKFDQLNGPQFMFNTNNRSLIFCDVADQKVIENPYLCPGRTSTKKKVCLL